MRIIPFTISLLATIALVVVLNIQLPAGGGKTPRLGAFLSPANGCWQNAEPTDEDFNASLKFPSLNEKVNVYFDERLVPHIYAENDSDAFFVQGFLHAKFRLWQMEFQTHAAGGRLSEIMGAKSGTTDFLSIDRMFRRLGMVYGAEQSLKEAEADPLTKSTTDAYTAGVNAYIENLPANKIPLEYKLLDYKPEPWTNLKTALFLKYMSWELAGGENDFEMTIAKSIFSSADIEKLYPVVGDSLDPVLPKGTVFKQPGVTLHKPVSVDSLYYNVSDSADPLFAIKPDKDNGSNNWAVAGFKTKSGRPILCNDPHLGLNLPSLWYEMQISTPTLNTYGVSFPGAPYIIIGFNDSCSWGFTNSSRDVKDYYEIKFSDTTMKEYWFNGELKKAGIRKEVIKVRGDSNTTENIAMTVFGPVMYDRTYASKLGDGKCYAVRWKAHDASNELLTFHKLDHAANFIDFIKAISTYKCPGQNMLFAAKRGDIAIRQQGEFPAKWWRQGDFVMPGTDSSFMWQGTIPKSENPMLFNPERGFLSSANQLPADNTYPYYLGGSFSPYRGFIINRRLGNMNNITVSDMESLQTDNYNVFAEMARPFLLSHIDKSRLSTEEMFYVNALASWNLRNDVNQEGATIFKVWWDSLEISVFKDEFARSKFLARWPDESALLEGLLKDPAYKFADDITTGATETVANAVQQSFEKAFKQLEILKQDNKLPWGEFKNTAVRHLLRLPSLSRLHLSIGGGEHVINATKFSHGPSWRMIVQLTDEIEAVGVYPGGQSGNTGSRFYDSFIDTWAAGKYYKLLFLPSKEADAGKNAKIHWKMVFNKG